MKNLTYYKSFSFALLFNICQQLERNKDNFILLFYHLFYLAMVQNCGSYFLTIA